MANVDVKTEMTGSVWKVMVSEGEVVSKGDELIIIESMKMEIPINSPSEGIVKNIRVKEGDYVPEGEIILTIE